MGIETITGVRPAGPATVPAELRDLPYPFQAALAICSDLDETPDADAYFELMRFLNTTAQTSLGPGLGLEVGNSLYFDMPPGHFSYWNTSEENRARLRALIRSGHIDCLHSYGDLATTRAHAERALDELERHSCRFRVWVDHAVAPTNFGADIMRGHGDEPGHPAYHADLTLAHGVRYVWRGRVTSVIGQDQPLSWRGLWNGRHPLASGRTILKEAGKQLMARAGSAKYALHAPNAIMVPIRLRDGATAQEILRCHPHWAGVSGADHARGLAEVLTPAFLDQLVAREGRCLLYTHLGKGGPLPPAGAAALRALRDRAANGEILVCTTRRLLDHRRMTRTVKLATQQSGSTTIVEVNCDDAQPADKQSISAAELQGLTFYVPEPEKVQVRFQGRPLAVQANPPDHTGRRSVSVPWTKLDFPAG